MLRTTKLITGVTLEKFRANGLRIGMLFSGGPASGGNVVMRNVVMRAGDHGVATAVFHHGYDSLVGKPVGSAIENCVEVTQAHLRLLRDQPGLVFGTARANPGKGIKTATDLADPQKTAALTQVLDVFEQLRIGALVSIGGDDTMRTANLLQVHFENIRGTGERKFLGVVHVPKTIDNDYVGVPFTFGFMTAATVFGEKIRNLHADAKATGTKDKPVVHLVEVMGRAAGYLTAAAAIYGEASYTIVPEDFRALSSSGKKIRLNELAADCAKVIEARAKDEKYYSVICIAEGIGDLIEVEASQLDDFGHQRLDEVNLADRLKDEISAVISKGQAKPKIITHKAGYEGRQVKPVLFDHLLCASLGVSAVNAILSGNFGCMVSYREIFEPIAVPFSDLVDPKNLKVRNRGMEPGTGLYDLLRASEKTL